MHIYSLAVELALPSRSLKGKRVIVKSIIARARQRFNVAAAEVDRQDDSGSAILGFATISSSRLLARQTLERLEEWLIEERPDVDITDTFIEEL